MQLLCIMLKLALIRVRFEVLFSSFLFFFENHSIEILVSKKLIKLEVELIHFEPLVLKHRTNPQ